MTESDKELFKRALTEGISNRIDRQIAECTEPVIARAPHGYEKNHKSLI